MFFFKTGSKFIKGMPIDANSENAGEIIQGALPSVLRLPLTLKSTDTRTVIQMLPQITVGARVLKGQLIATDHKTTYLHAPTSGTIQKIASFPVGYTTEFSLKESLSVTYQQQFADCIELVPDEKEEAITYTPLHWQHCTPIELYNKIVQSGISCLSTIFSDQTQIDLIPTIQTLMINATECDPQIQTLSVLISEETAHFMEGMAIVAKIFSAKKVLIAIHEKQVRLQKNLQQAIDQASFYFERQPQFESQPQIVTIEPKYPLGHPKVLIQQLTIQKTSDQTNLQKTNTVACIDSATIIAVYRAITKGQPLISRTIHFTGRALLKPGHYEMLIGTPLNEALDQAALKPHKLHRLIMGSAMTGASLEDASIPITKTMMAIIAATEAEMPTTPQEHPCIRCGQCESVCPVNLLPDALYQTIKAEQTEKILNYRLMDCIECGACAAICPSHIPLVGYFQFSKQKIQQTKNTQLAKDLARLRFEQRTQRIEKEKILKEMQRQQRRQAATVHYTETTNHIKITNHTENTVPDSALSISPTPNNALHPTEISTAQTSTTETSTTKTRIAETLTIEQLKNNLLKIRKIYQATEKALAFSKKAGKSAEDIAQATAQLAKLQHRMQEAEEAVLLAEQSEKAEKQIAPD